MSGPRVVLDTNVVIAALRSQRGASYRLLMLVGTGRFDINLSVPMVLEYEEVAKRLANEIRLSLPAIDDIIDYLCSVALQHNIHYLWRPVLPDPKDDMVLEVAVAGQCAFIVTYNGKHFGGAQQFGIGIITPAELLAQMGALP